MGGVSDGLIARPNWEVHHLQDNSTTLSFIPHERWAGTGVPTLCYTNKLARVHTMTSTTSFRSNNNICYGRSTLCAALHVVVEALPATFVIYSPIHTDAQSRMTRSGSRILHVGGVHDHLHLRSRNPRDVGLAYVRNCATTVFKVDMCSTASITVSAREEWKGRTPYMFVDVT